MELFKYCKLEHMHGMLRHGSTRVGTLFDWRRSDCYGELVSDMNEGYTPCTGNIIFYDATHTNAIKIDSVVNERNKFGEVTGRNIALRADNHFAFSTSSKYSLAEHSMWNELEGYNACYRILSAELFFGAISRTPILRDAAEFVCFAPALYIDSTSQNTIFQEAFHPALLKQSSFSNQNEVRALWSPNSIDTMIEPLLIPSSDARLYVSEYAVIS